MSGKQIVSTGYYVPERIVPNSYFESIVDTSDTWIQERTGICQRHFVEEETTIDLGYQAAKKAIENGNIDIQDIGIIIVATMTPEYFTPCTASLIQERLGMNNQEVMAFDISVACSGFVYGLEIAKSLLQTRQDKYALIIGSEVFSKMLDFTDRGTCILFGDGAGAVILKHSEQMFISYQDSSGKTEALYAPCAQPQYLQMQGQEVFKFAVKVIPKSIERVLQMAKLSLDDIDYVVCHQANYRIISYVYRKMKSDASKFYVNVQNYGNTSAASIPLALGEMDEKGMLKAGMKIICVGFGGGLSWGATLLEW